MKYKVCFIDGFDLKYKVNVLEADTKEEAVEKTFEKYGSNFDHALVDAIPVK